MTITVRAASAGDVETLLGLVEEYWRFEAIDGFERGRVGAELRRVLVDDRLGAAWLAFAGDASVGYLLAVYVFSLEHLGLTAEIDEFFVRPDHRAHGIGRRLLQAAEAQFTSRGCTSVSLQLGRGNDAGRAFYVRHGYAPRAGFELLDRTLPVSTRR